MTIEKTKQQNTLLDTQKPRIFSDDEIRTLGLDPVIRPIEEREQPLYLTDEDREKFGSAGEPPTFIRTIYQNRT